MADLIVIENPSGLKCDTPDCGYSDDSIQREDFSLYINAPCPDCSGPLLTQVDYDFWLAMESTVKFLNTLAGDTPDGPRDCKLEVNMNGTGIPSFKMRDV
jgi:hypothetical protein